jgi:CheY-like chemotaxis protein
MLTPTHRSCRGYPEPKRRILYIGRDQELLVALRKVLRKSEYHIVSCPDRASAILFLEGDPRYDLLLFEFELRGKTGLELTVLARSLSHREHLPIVIITAGEIIDDQLVASD